MAWRIPASLMGQVFGATQWHKGASVIRWPQAPLPCPASLRHWGSDWESIQHSVSDHCLLLLFQAQKERGTLKEQDPAAQPSCGLKCKMCLL